MSSKRPLFALLLALLVAASSQVFGAATIVIQNGDPAGVGFNDPTPVAPVGGNAGTTLGQQRLNAFQYAANIWGATLTSTQTIVVLSTFEALTCTATSAVLGSAGAQQVFRDFGGAPVAGHWYGQALANKLAGVNLDPATADIRARFNVNLGQPGCLTGTFFYLGLDNNHGANVDLVTVLLHEFAHGLGFQTFTNGSTGAQLSGFPSISDDFLLDTSTSKNWTQMTAPERQASAINTDNLVWSGANVSAAVPNVLQLGLPVLTVSAPASAAGTYFVGTASFGAVLTSPGLSGAIAPVVDTAPSTGLACTPLSPLNAASVNGKIALVDRGVCGFTVKALNVQNAGATGVIIVNNVAGSPAPGLGGTDPAVTIPAVMVTQSDGNQLKSAALTRSRLLSGLQATMGVDLSFRAGADTSNRPFMFAPNPFQSGSSVSHWSQSATPNQLMEPAISGDLSHSVTPPADLTFPMLRDIGWN